MELYQLEQFVAVAESGSMASAADRLFLSRSAISQNLKRLEQELGCELFARKHNKLEITPYGEILLKTSKSIMDELSECRNDILAEKAKQNAEIRVSHFSFPLSYFKMPHLAQSFPQYTFSVNVCDAQQAIQNLVDGVVDVAIVSDSTPIPPALTQTLVEREQACLSVPSTSKFYDHDQISLESFEEEKILITDGLTGVSDWYASLARKASIRPEDVVVVPADEYLSTMSESDYCHFSTAQMIGFFGLGNGRREVPIVDDEAKRHVVLLAREKEDKRIKDIVGYLKSHQDERFDTYDIIPYLIFPGQVSNLQITLDNHPA